MSQECERYVWTCRIGASVCLVLWLTDLRFRAEWGCIALTDKTPCYAVQL